MIRGSSVAGRRLLLLLPLLVLLGLVPGNTAQNNTTTGVNVTVNEEDPCLIPDGDVATEYCERNYTFGPGGCYQSTDHIFSVIRKDELLFTKKRFVMCPGTVTNVGFVVAGVGVNDGNAPLVARSNTEFLCGEDGNPENNCIIRGGDFGIVAVPIFFRQDLSISNVVIRGFTFEEQNQYSFFTASAGDITVQDCIFRNQANFGTAVFNYDSSFDFRRALKEHDFDKYENKWDAFLDYVEALKQHSEDKRQRKLAGESFEHEKQRALEIKKDGGRRLQVEHFTGIFRNVLFTNNQQVRRQPGVEFGVVTVKTADHTVELEDCTFAENTYGDRDLIPQGYAILATEAEMMIKGCCFINNDFLGAAPIILELTDEPSTFMDGNYATLGDGGVECELAAYYATEEDRQNFNHVCYDSQVDECGGSPIERTNAPIPDDGATSENGSQTASITPTSDASTWELARFVPSLVMGISSLLVLS